MAEYGRLIDHVGHIGQRGSDRTYYYHVLSDHTQQPDVYITTAYRETWGEIKTWVNTNANPIGEAGLNSRAQFIDAPPDVNGQDRDALRVYHQGIVADFTAQPARRTYTAPAPPPTPRERAHITY